MLLFEEQIQKAESRASVDLAAAIVAMQNKTPEQMARGAAKNARETFLRETVERPDEASRVFERILQGNELQPVSYLERGSIAARAIARIAVRSPTMPPGWGTGFLIAPNVLITNNHVLPDAATAALSKAHLSYELDLGDQEIGPVIFDLNATALFHTSKPLDFSIVAVAPRSKDGTRNLTDFGFLPLLDVQGKAMEGEWLTVVQHPGGELKQVCVRENKLIKRDDDVLWYSTDTLPGSSGSPVFNNDWFVVALHHSGVPEREASGEFKTVDGRPYVSGVTSELQVKWIANEGIRASRIVQTLKSALPQHALLQPLFNATPQSARIARRSMEASHLAPVSPKAQTMSESRIVNLPLDVRVEIGTDGSVRLAGTGMHGATEATNVVEEKSSSGKRREANFDAPFEDDYDTRDGFQPAFLGAKTEVNLPQMSAALEKQAAELIGKKNVFELKYHNFSVVMHAKRRLAIYSAANVDFSQRYDMNRPKDVWRRDPRILTEHQLENWYYASNKFDRGHLTRREDLEFGKTAVKALQSAADTCHWTNCTPQHEEFNQNKEIWQGIERYILEQSIIGGKFKAQVITGPVFHNDDPDYKGVQYPVQYWKVVAALTDDDDLFATAYLASQQEVIDKYGIEAAVPFGAYKTFQIKIADIERITGLTFHYGAGKRLRDLDPLEKAPRRRARRSSSATEAAAMQDFGNYNEIAALEDIHI